MLAYLCRAADKMGGEEMVTTGESAIESAAVFEQIAFSTVLRHPAIIGCQGVLRQNRICRRYPSVAVVPPRNPPKDPRTDLAGGRCFSG